MEQVRAERNKAVKSRVKTYIKKVEAAVAAGDKAAANEALPVAIAEIEKAASKGIFHKNAAARKVSHITKAVNSRLNRLISLSSYLTCNYSLLSRFNVSQSVHLQIIIQ